MTNAARQDDAHYKHAASPEPVTPFADDTRLMLAFRARATHRSRIVPAKEHAVAST